MLQIAVCDDEPAQLRQLAAVLREYLRERPALAGRVALFSGGEALLEAVKARGGFDLYLLDVVMPGCGGIQVGQRLRELGEQGEILYLTASDEYAVDSYCVGAFYYLLKPMDHQKLFWVLDRAVQRLARRHSEGIVVSTHGGSRRLLLEQILYVEQVDRRLRYYCVDGTVDSVTLRVPFKEAVAPLLADGRFFLCGASYLLNLQHVSGVEGRAALLDSGAQVPLPRTVVAEFKEAWGRFWLEEPLK